MKRIKATITALAVVFVLLSVNSCATKWAKTYGGTESDSPKSIQQTADGGYVVAGSTESFGAGGYDLWVLKLGTRGCIEWQKTYGGTEWDRVFSMQQTANGGYIVAGETWSFGAGYQDLWVLKLDAGGDVEWQKIYGGSGSDYANSVRQTADGGYIAAGVTTSFGAGDGDLWVLKLNTSGGVQWQKTYGGSSSDYANSIRQTADGGYIVAGETRSFGAADSNDVWVLKLDASGDVVWQKTYGGTGGEGANSIQQTADNGYIVAGVTGSFGAGSADFWVLKLTASGDVQWQKTYGDSNREVAESIQRTADNGYIVAGLTTSFGASSGDLWALKLDANGEIQWQKTYGGSTSDWANSIRQTADGGYVMAGLTGSFGAGSTDFWVLKLDAYGNISDSCPASIGQDTSGVSASTSVVPENSQAAVSGTSCTVASTNVTPHHSNAIIDSQCVLAWSMSYGGTNNDNAHSIQKTADGGYIVAGETASFGTGNSDLWILKMEPGGCLQWQKTYGGAYDDKAYFIQQTEDDGYIVTGETKSFGAGHIDNWVLKLDEDGDIQWQKTYGGTSYETAVSIQQTADGGYIVAGYTYSFGAGSADLWIVKLAASGAVQWQKTYGGTNDDRGYCIKQTIDGGYVVAGSTASFGGTWGERFWVLKLDEDGDIQWQKTYGSISDIARSIQQTSDGGYIVAGVTWSSGAGGADLWVLRLDTNGEIQWQKTYGGSSGDAVHSIQQTREGGYIAAGGTASFGAGSADCWVLKLNSEGSISGSCPAGIGRASSVVPVNTSAAPEDSLATVSSSSCTVTSTSVTPQGSNAVVETQCYN